MLLNNEVLEQTDYIAYQMHQAGVNIQPKAGTLLETMVTAYMTNPKGCVRSAVKNGDLVNDEFDEITTAFIDQLTLGIRSEMDTARNVLKPIVSTLVETYNDITVTENMEMFTPNIVMHRLPSVFENSTFSSMIEEGADRFDASSPMPGLDSRVKYSKTVTVEYLRAAMVTGITSIDDRTSPMLEKFNNADLLGIYNRCFCQGQYRLATVSVEEGIILYLITLAMLRELPDDCNGLKAEFTLSLTAFRNRMASFLNSHHTNYKRLITSKVLVVDYEINNQEHTITVVPQVYIDTYLRKGGTPETLLGAMLLNTHINTPVDELLLEMFLRRCDNKYNLVREVALRDIEKHKADLALGNLRRALSITLDGIYEAADEATLDLTGERAGCVNRAITYTNETGFTTSTDLTGYVFGLLGATLEHGKFYVNVLCQLNRSLTDNSKITPEQAVALYVEYRITDWLSLLAERVD